MYVIYKYRRTVKILDTWKRSSTTYSVQTPIDYDNEAAKI